MWVYRGAANKWATSRSGTGGGGDEPVAMRATCGCTGGVPVAHTIPHLTYRGTVACAGGAIGAWFTPLLFH